METGPDLELVRLHVNNARGQIVSGTAKSEPCATSKYADMCINLASLCEALADELDFVKKQVQCKHENKKQEGWGEANWVCVDCKFHGRHDDAVYMGGRPLGR